MTVTINGTSGITTPGVNSTGSNVLGDNVADTLNVGNGAIVTDSSGNVGIGAAPSSTNRLEVSSSGTTRLVVANTANSVVGRLQTESAAFLIQTDTNHPVKFAINNGAEVARFDTSGNLLVGTTSTLGDGKVHFKATSASAVMRAQVYADGWYVLGCMNAAGSTVGGVVANASTTTYATTSDYRLKENIQPMQNALAVVQQLNPVTYTWKADGSDGQGFIAHELQAVVPDCVTGEKDAVDAEGNPVYQGIDTSFLVATLTKAIQELTARVEQLEAKNVA